MKWIKCVIKYFLQANIKISYISYFTTNKKKIWYVNLVRIAINSRLYTIDRPITRITREKQEAIRFRKQVFALRPLLRFFRLFGLVVLYRVVCRKRHYLKSTWWQTDGECVLIKAARAKAGTGKGRYKERCYGI